VGKPGVEVGTLLRRVAADVYKVTDERQLPKVSVSLLGDFYFAGAPDNKPAAAQTQVATVTTFAPPPLDATAQSAVDGCDKVAASPQDVDRPSGWPASSSTVSSPRLPLMPAVPRLRSRLKIGA
jgi:hypothetical protein